MKLPFRLAAQLLPQLLVVLLLTTTLAACQFTDTQTATRTVTADRHLLLGNPSGAVANPARPANYLIERDQYSLAYDRDRGIPNWVSWHLEAADLGDTERYSGQFITDQSLPEGWYRVQHSDYSGSGYDRGHMTPSADRTVSPAANQATFILTNVLPQAPENNQGLWADLENEARSLVNEGNELYQLAGGWGRSATLAGGKLTIPAAVWKVILVLPAADGNDLARVTPRSQVIAIWTPNDASVQGKRWQDYTISVACIEQRTGLDIFAALDDPIEQALQGGPCREATPTEVVTQPGGGSAGGPASCATSPDPAAARDNPIQIIAIDKDAETVTLLNVSAQAINLDGWLMCSLKGSQEHPLSGSLAPGKSRVFPGSGDSIWSNSATDAGALYDPQGRLISYWPDL